MSGAWTPIRDTFESVASIAGNYFLPGSGLLTSHLVSKGSQKQLGSTLGQIGMLGSGLAGGFGVGGDTVGARFDNLTNLGQAAAPTVGSTAAGASGGLDTIGNMVQNVPEGETAGSFSAKLGYPSTDAWMAAGAGSTPYTEATMLDKARGQQGDALRARGINGQPGITDLVKGIGNGSTSMSDFTEYLRNVGSPLSTITGNAGAAGSMPWGSIGNLATLGTGAYGLYQSEQLKKLAGKQLEDPFAEQRGQYGGQLAALNSNPGAVLPTLPGYQAGLDAVQRSMAAQGYTGSGNMMAALQQYGGNAFQQESMRLANLSGINQQPERTAAGMATLAGGMNLGLNSLGLLGRAAGAA